MRYLNRFQTFKSVKKLVFLLIFLMAHLCPSEAQARKRKEPDKFERICNSAQKIGEMIAPWTGQIVKGIAMTPLGPTPVIGASQILLTSSPFFELCELYQKMRRLETREFILEAAEVTNDLFNDAFNAEMSLMRDTFDIYANTQNILNHKDPKSKLFTQQYARKLNRFIGSVNTYSEERGGSRIEALSNRQEQERSMRLLVRQAAQISKYQSFLKCPKENPINPKVRDTYTEDSQKLFNLINQFQADETYLLAKLRDMGIKISSYEKDLEEYLVEVSRLSVEGVSFNSQFREYEEESHYTNEEKEADTRMITKTYQVVTIVRSPDLFEKFKEKYAKNWRSYAVTNVMTSGDESNLLTRGSRRVDDEWTDLYFHCRRHRFEFELRRSGNWDELNDDLFHRMVDDRVRACKEGGSLKEIENALSYFTDQLFTAVSLRKQYQAELWTLDSFAFGQVRNINYSPEEFKNASVPSEEVTCSEKLNIGQLKAAQAQLANLNNASREEVANIYFERLAIKNAEEERRKKRELENERRRALEAERERRKNLDYNQFVTFPDLKSGF